MTIWWVVFLKCFQYRVSTNKTFGHFCEAHKILISKCHKFSRLINIWPKYGPLNAMMGTWLLNKDFYTLIFLSIFLLIKIFENNIRNQNIIHILLIFGRIWCEKKDEQDSSLKCSAWKGFKKIWSKKNFRLKKNFNKFFSLKKNVGLKKIWGPK